ncbi:hypothetical protein Patl1_19875 [Pistacia atlantica]|uniref:Uncharacterized protein n=1 Tax=Pistacia atlantica TaxID=434234 RepID=A0ACC1BKU5_9ROSI|nr:hypothetical protein Patl1_19875 [Pistacia atlantica]
MDRHLEPHFKIQAGSFPVIYVLSKSICLTSVDRFLFPMWKKLIQQLLTLLQRIGVGHFIIMAAMVVGAVFESKRLKIIHTHHPQVQAGSGNHFSSLNYNTTSLNSLRPPPCKIGSNLCKTPLKMQFPLLYTSLAPASMGQGLHTLLATVGANQLDKPQHREIFFNWYYFTLCTSFVKSATTIVYTEENISWRIGFCVCIAANFIGLAIFLLGIPFLSS